MTGTKRVFVLVASQFNAKYVQGLVTHCYRRITQTFACVECHIAPGAGRF